MPPPSVKAQIPPTFMPVPPLAVLVMRPVLTLPLLMTASAFVSPPIVVDLAHPAMPASIISVASGLSPVRITETLLVTFEIVEPSAYPVSAPTATTFGLAPVTVIWSPAAPSLRFLTVAPFSAPNRPWR